MAECNEEHDAFTGAMGQEEGCDIVVEECEAAGTEGEGVGGKVHFPSDDGGFELGNAITTIAEACQYRVEIDQKIDIDGGISSEVLAEGEELGLPTEVARFELFEGLLILMKHVGAWSEVLCGIDDEVERAERGSSGVEAVRWDGVQ